MMMIINDAAANDDATYCLVIAKARGCWCVYPGHQSATILLIKKKGAGLLFQVCWVVVFRFIWGPKEAREFFRHLSQ